MERLIKVPVAVNLQEVSRPDPFALWGGSRNEAFEDNSPNESPHGIA